MLQENGSTLRRSPKGTTLFEFARELLTKIGMGSLLKTQNEVLSDRVEHITNHYKGKLESTKRENDTLIDTTPSEEYHPKGHAL